MWAKGTEFLLQKAPFNRGFLLARSHAQSGTEQGISILGIMPFFRFWRFGLSKLEQRLSEMLNPAVEALGFELLGVEFVCAGKHSILRVYIDHENGINVDDCADVSHQVSAVLDVEDPINTEYNLEVSSPGMDRPLFKEAHYAQVVGETVAVRMALPLDNRRNFKGKLLACENGTLTIEVDGEQFKLPFSGIEKGNLVPTFE